MSAFRRRLMFAKADPTPYIFTVDNTSFEYSTTSSRTIIINLESSENWTITNSYQNITCSPSSGNAGTYAINVTIAYESSSDGMYSISISNSLESKTIYITNLYNFLLYYTEITYNDIYLPENGGNGIYGYINNGTKNPLLSTLSNVSTTTENIIIYICGEYISGVLTKQTYTSSSCDNLYTHRKITITSSKFTYNYSEDSGVSSTTNYYYSPEYDILVNGYILHNLFKIYKAT